MSARATINTLGLKCKKHSPEILMGFGILGTIAGCFVVAKKTKEHMENKYLRDVRIEELTQELEEEDHDEEEVVEIKKEVKKEVRRYVVDEIRIWSVPVVIELGSITCILASNYIMRKRIAGLTAAFATVSTAFDQYRERVRERYGDEVDQSILLGEKQVTIETTDEKGKTKKETITVADPDISSIGRYLTRSNPNWSDSEAFMDNFFSLQMSYATDALRARGFTVLNNLYDLFDFEKDTEAGIVVGKVFDRNATPEENSIKITWKKVKLPDQYGNLDDAYYVDFPGLEIIYGAGAQHRSIVD